MSKLSPRMEKLLSYQKIAIACNTCIAVAGGIGAATAVEDNLLMSCCFAVFCSWTISSVLNWCTSTLLSYIIYRGDWHAVYDDAEQAGRYFDAQIDAERAARINEQEMLEQQEHEHDTEQDRYEVEIVNKPERAIGVYLDSEIYEWLELKTSEGPALRFEFIGTLTYRDGDTVTVPDNCVLLPPGLLYQKCALAI